MSGQEDRSERQAMRKRVRRAVDRLKTFPARFGEAEL
jgi:hypothetical protein